MLAPGDVDPIVPFSESVWTALVANGNSALTVVVVLPNEVHRPPAFDVQLRNHAAAASLPSGVLNLQMNVVGWLPGAVVSTGWPLLVQLKLLPPTIQL